MGSSNSMFAERLRQNGSWIVESSARQITMIKRIGKTNPKAVTVKLEKEKDGTFTIMPCIYKFSSTVSHFTYPEDEMRWARNKGIFSSLISTLKETGMWNSVRNKNYIVVNEGNPNLNKAKVKKEFRSIMGTRAS